ncbi:MAG: hypothetical protein V1790_05760 [Planctomycetota bacterium]
MDGLTLLEHARSAGLTVVAEGDRLRIRGSRRAEHVALSLIANKAAILAVLVDRTTTVADLPPDWRLEFEERAAIREYDGGQLREHAERDALAETVARIRPAGGIPPRSQKTT